MVPSSGPVVDVREELVLQTMLSISSVNHLIPPRVEPAETFVFLPAPMRTVTGPMSPADVIESSGTLRPPQAPPRMNNQEFHPLDVVSIEGLNRDICAR
jgi:hypothetical protein